MSVKKINISGNEYDIKDANTQAMISDEFDSGTSYTTGDYCIYENVLYKFTSNKSAGAWDSGKVAATNIDTELSELNSSCLRFMGAFTGDFNSLDIEPGIYDIDAPGTATNQPAGVEWCVFIQFPYRNSQLVINTNVSVVRKYTGNPAQWSKWQKYNLTDLN